jgi:hypothetical protein
MGEPRQHAEYVADACLSVAAVLDMFAPPGDDDCVRRWLFDE